MPFLAIVMLGAFVAQTTEYLPIGLLGDMARNLDVSEAKIGVLVTGYAWIAALTAIPFTLLSNHLDRRLLFLALLAIITVSNLLAAVSPTYAMLAAARVLTALTHGVFWSILATLATRLAPAVPPNRALAFAFSGISLAIVAGIPAANALGQRFGWRSAFAVFAVFGLVVAAAGAARFPPVPAARRHDRHGSTFANRRLFHAAEVTALIITAHFCGDTYIVPLLTNVASVSPSAVPWFLLVFGFSGMAGTLVAGWMRCPPAVLALSAAVGIVTSQALMATSGTGTIATAVEMVLWGGSISMLIVGLQGWVLTLAPSAPDTASALYVAAFNFGIGFGAATGGVALIYTGYTGVLVGGIGIGTIAVVDLWRTVWGGRIRSPKGEA